MEENVALDSSQQKQFVKSVRGIKKLLKKKNKNAQKSATSKDEIKPKVEIKPLKVTKVKKIKRRKLRGLVYISHIPHGFYEPQMAEYFKQFGVVTNVRVIRSKKTGNSKGFAFVEFKEPSVAEIVAETMNNYLMGKRLLKAVYIPPKKQKLNVFRKNWNNQNNPASEQRLKIRKAYNASKTDVEELKIAKKLLASLSKTKEKLSNLGIDYDFFKPVDVPEELKNIADKIGNKKEEKETKSEKKIKTDLTEAKVENNKKKIKLETKENNENKSNKQTKVKGPLKAEAESNNKLNIKTVKTDNKLVKDVKNQVKSKKDKNKNDKVKIEDIKPLQNFISIKNDDDNSSSEDEDDDFDSDEFEKLMENDDEDDMSSGEESDEENEDSEAVTESEDDQSEKKGKQQKAKQNNNLLTKNTAKVTRSNVSKKSGPENSNVGNQLQKKRKNVQNAPVAPKKAKFEKQNKKKPLKKVIKKKK